MHNYALVKIAKGTNASAVSRITLSSGNPLPYLNRLITNTIAENTSSPCRLGWKAQSEMSSTGTIVKTVYEYTARSCWDEFRYFLSCEWMHFLNLSACFWFCWMFGMSITGRQRYKILGPLQWATSFSLLSVAFPWYPVVKASGSFFSNYTSQNLQVVQSIVLQIQCLCPFSSGKDNNRWMSCVCLVIHIIFCVNVVHDYTLLYVVTKVPWFKWFSFD